MEYLVVYDTLYTSYFRIFIADDLDDLYKKMAKDEDLMNIVRTNKPDPMDDIMECINCGTIKIRDGDDAYYGCTFEREDDRDYRFD
jgi:hypothetical protein